MTKPLSPTARKSRLLRRLGAACLAVAWVGGIVAAVLGVRISWPSWLLLVAASGAAASDVLRPTRPKASDYLVLAMGILSIAAVIGLVVTRP
jgi:hypothetical protein